ncbi:dTDP-4-dehydrorhamnose reductase [Pseudoalteromonas spongiae]|uniref:dTDP-4-dehydrorhamnose reductase n=1 Tax=Pseudoalteromonas spongiae TaxID=298657 RepID=UPI0037355AF8
MIVVIGKSGQLAQELHLLDSDLVCLGRNDINLLNKDDVFQTLDKFSPDAVINASAYTAVDKAETEEEQAFLINAEAVKFLAEYCEVKQCHLVHVSTDYVFKGDKGSPYLTSDNREPRGIYGASKAQGEQYLSSLVNTQACIIRTSWVYSSHGNNFVKTMLNLMSQKDELGVISDQIGTPTSAKVLAQACLAAAKNKVCGTQHWTDLGIASWYDFALAIQEIAYEKGALDKRIPVKPINTEQYPTPASRPKYSVLDKTKNSDELDVENAHWRVHLSTVIEELIEKK